jgi:ATP-binding cassette subfamily B (MDR/TAP) protein 1
LALVAISLLPVLVVLGFFQVKLMDHLQDHLRDAYGTSAALVCEQIASIRTVASLRRENAILAEFQNSINVPVRKAMISTIKSTLVFFHLDPFLTL